MANTFVDYTVGAGQTDFAFSFPYLDDSHVVVQLDDSTGSSPGGKFYTVSTGDYTIITSPSTLIRFTTAPETGARIRIKRDSASDVALVDFENGSVLTETELDRAYLHNLYLNEEIEEGSGKSTMTKNTDGNYDADLAKIINVADPTSAQDAATKNYVDTQDALQVTKAGDNMTGDLAMGNNKITGLGTPTASTDAVTKAYADTLTLNGATEDYVNQQISNQITGSSTAPYKYNFTGNGSTTAFTFSPGISLSDDSMYEVAIDGVLQEPTVAYAIDSTANTITFTSAPPSSSNIVVVQRGYSVPVTAGLSLSGIESINNNTLLGNDSGSSAAPQALTSTEVRTVLNVADGATANDTDANLKNRANHTGTQLASTISDFDTEVANNSAVAANTAKVSNATHTGDVTGDTVLTIADNAVTSAKISSTDTLFNVNDTQGTIGIGILANSSSSSPKVKMDGNVQVGNQASTVPGELSVTGDGSINLLTVENTATTGQSVVIVKGPSAVIQMNDTQAPANEGIYQITMDSGYLQINLINDNGTDGGGLLRLRPNGNLSIAGTLSQNGLT